MNYYPVYIPTLNRYEHFKNCVVSLSRCTHADKTDLIIGLDFPPSAEYSQGHTKIKEFVYQIQGFRKVTIIEHRSNLGASDNWRYLMHYCFERYDACIGSEDDNIFSPCFLDYMNKALDMYQDDCRILSVSGYNHEPFYNQGLHSCFFSMDSCAWGIGLWKNKEYMMEALLRNALFYQELIHSFRRASIIYFMYPALYNMLCDMVDMKECWDDVMRTSINILKGYRQLHPSVSLVRNCGYDGSGLHCGIDNEIGKQIISESKLFDFGNTVGKFKTITNFSALHFQCISRGSEKEIISEIRKRFISNTLNFHGDPIFQNRVLRKIVRRVFLFFDSYLNKFLAKKYQRILYGQ